MKTVKLLWAALMISLLAMAAAQAEIPESTDNCLNDDVAESTPSSDFTTLEDGAVVRHLTTGLEWRRCPEGMDWTGSGCSGDASGMTWSGALRHAGSKPDWRLPSIDELRSIVEQCRDSPAINQAVFPNTPGERYWTATPYADYADIAWIVYFSSGNDYWNYWNRSSQVRLVRGTGDLEIGGN